MMKKRVFAGALALLLGISLAGCNFGGSSGPYTIQYTDDAGTHVLTVESGMPFSLESIPSRVGYDFLGLYDAQTGGTQYVGSNGASLAPYQGGGNKVLFPQFKPIDYTVVLDYQGANVTGERSFTVAYDEMLPPLPTDLTLAHNEFAGWYTEEGCRGTQVADAFGNLPLVSVLNAENFSLDDARRVTLYAGFKLEKHAVTLVFGEGMQPEVLMVPYDTPVGQVFPATRNENRQAVLTWSTEENDVDGEHIFGGNIKSEMTLYAQEWAPVIELDGVGVDVPPIVARAGSKIALPTPQKPLAKFLHWETENGETKDLTTMPETSLSLRAVWQGKIEFDENGGTDVDNLSESAGESISLPTPEREGYLFAGWYTAEKERYTAEKMPAEGLALKAGWYKAKSCTEILKKDSNDEDNWAYSGWSNTEIIGPQSDWRKKIDLSEYCDVVNRVIFVTIHCDMKSHCSSFIWEGGFYLYDGAVVSDANFLTKATDTVSADSWKTYTFQRTFTMRDDILYLCYYARKTTTTGMGYCELFFKNFYAEITYPDTTQLYL